ncbi:MAG: carbohydrate-binding family 9-like protein, partial [Candidatus Pacebacteria bacterium]|nr:carbohydrate-binding family 9-like protein [Candidatus Paceibacterota bacterium]
MATYLVKHTRTRPTMQGHWDGPAWNSIESVAIASACPGRVSRHKPETHVKLQYDGRGIYGIFKVKDQYIRCTTIQHNGSVCTDSCVEFFVKPHRGEGYFNFEFNCGGTLLCSYIRDHTRIDGGFRDFTPIPREDAVMLDIYHTMPRYIPQEIEEQR